MNRQAGLAMRMLVLDDMKKYLLQAFIPPDLFHVNGFY
jgi:hypothetical protein